jgi:hypothetical protein
MKSFSYFLGFCLFLPHDGFKAKACPVLWNYVVAVKIIMLLILPFTLVKNACFTCVNGTSVNV